MAKKSPRPTFTGSVSVTVIDPRSGKPRLLPVASFQSNDAADFAAAKREAASAFDALASAEESQFPRSTTDDGAYIEVQSAMFNGNPGWMGRFASGAYYQQSGDGKVIAEFLRAQFKPSKVWTL